MAMGGNRCRRPRAIRHGRRLILDVSVLALGWGLAAALSAQTQTSTEQLFAEAQAARFSGNLAAAEKKYQEVIRRDPQLVSAYQNLGIVYFSQRKYRDAIDVLEKGVKLDPRLAGAHMILGLAHYELYQSEKAVKAFQDAHRLDPHDTKVLFYLGKAQMQMRNYREAAQTFEKLSESRSKDPDVLYNLGLAHLKLFLDATDRLGEIAPYSHQYLLLEAQDAEGHNNHAAAIQYYQEALRSKPEGAGIHYGLGSAYSRAGKFEEAAQEFKAELQISPQDSLALWRLGEITLHTNPREAVQVLQQAVSLNPEFPQAVLAYGRALLRAGQTEAAVDQFQRVVRLAPEEDTVHYLLAQAYRQQGRQGEAKAELARFEEMAKKKSEQRKEAARQLVESTGEAQQPQPELEPGFSPSRNPVHP